MREIILDTETTGLEVEAGHRIIEVACVEIVSRRITGNNFHRYLNPGRKSDPRALEVHGLRPEFLEDKPAFKEIWPEFHAFVCGAQLVIHNAEFDLAFLDVELEEMNLSGFLAETSCSVIDTLERARELHPGLQNNLDALSDRYAIDRTRRKDRHGALIDSELLAKVYLAMTGGQTAMKFHVGDDTRHGGGSARAAPPACDGLPVIRADAAELERHRHFMEWLRTEAADAE